MPFSPNRAAKRVNKNREHESDESDHDTHKRAMTDKIVQKRSSNLNSEEDSKLIHNNDVDESDSDDSDDNSQYNCVVSKSNQSGILDSKQKDTSPINDSILSTPSNMNKAGRVILEIRSKNFTSVQTSEGADSSSPLSRGIIGSIPVSINMPDFSMLKERNVEEFVKRLKSTHNFRSTVSQPTIPVQDLPDIDDVIDTFKEFTTSEECGLYQQMRIAGVSGPTILNAASSCIYVLSFIKSSGLETFKQCHAGHGFTKAVIQKLSSMSTVQKCNFTTAFTLWYEKLPPARTSNTKLVETGYDVEKKNIESFVQCTFLVADRSQTKENNTMRTVIRGLFAFLTYVNVIEPSSDRSPTAESKELWGSVNATLRVCHIRKGGAVKHPTGSICMLDLQHLMKQVEGVSDVYELQSWILGVVLAGTGLRVGSIRQGVPRVSIQEGSFVDSSDDETVNEETDTPNQPTTSEELNIDFDSLKCNDVEIFRIPKKEPSEPCRLYVVLTVYSSKTTGNSVFTPQKLGYNFPTKNPDGSEEWSVGTAFALTVLSIINGTCDVNKIIEDEYEPPAGSRTRISDSNTTESGNPLFRSSNCHRRLLNSPLRNTSSALSSLAMTLKIPDCIFTSRSFRKGFARSIVMGLVAQGDETRIVPVSQLRDALFTSARWRSCQVDRYIEDVSRNIVSAPSTTIGITAFDWQAAVTQCTPLAKLSTYVHICDDNLEQHLDTLNKQSTDSHMVSLKQKEKADLISVMNAQNWKDSIVSMSPEEYFSLKSGSIDVKRTLEELMTFLSTNPMFSPFCGYGRSRSTPPHTCPVAECMAVFDTVSLSCAHWMSQHESNKAKARYMCFECPQTGECSLHSFTNHLARKHPRDNSIKFNWVYKNE